MLHDPLAARSAPTSIAAADRPDLKTPRPLADDLLSVLRDLLDAHHEVRLQAASTPALTIPLDRQDALLERLQETVVSLRGASFVKLFKQMKGLTQDLARRLDREVDLEMRGADTTVDVAMLEALEDPLAQLVRNSLEHGLEPPTERAVQGKPPRGKLILEAGVQQGAVFVEVRDDGRGLPGEAAAQGGCLALGRGLARVERDLTALHGSLRVRPSPSGGCAARCAVPLLFRFVDGLLLECGGHRLVLASTCVHRVLSVRPEILARPGGTLALWHDGVAIPLLHLAVMLDHDQAATAVPPAQAVLLRDEGEPMALGVHAVLGRHRGAVTPLPPCCAWHPALSGCMLLPGGVGFVLDVEGLRQG